MSLVSETLVNVVQCQDLVAEHLHVETVVAGAGDVSQLTTNDMTVNGTTTVNAPSPSSATAIVLNATDVKTYPTTPNFTTVLGLNVNMEVGTNQIVDNAFNFVYVSNYNTSKGSGSTSDIDNLYWTDFNNSFVWTDLNTCTQYTGIEANFLYEGINANGRTSSAFNANTEPTIFVNSNLNGNQSISKIENCNINIQDSLNLYTIGDIILKNTSVVFADSTGPSTATIADLVFYDTNFDVAWTLGTVTITNLFGMRLSTPTGSGLANLLVANNWGVYQDWDVAKNYFAGNVTIQTTAPSASAALNVNIGTTPQGFLPPRMTAQDAQNIANKALGLIVFITDITGHNPPFTSVGWWGYDGVAPNFWQPLH